MLARAVWNRAAGQVQQWNSHKRVNPTSLSSSFCHLVEETGLTDLSDAESADEVDDAGGEARAEHEVPGGPVAQLGLVVRRYLLGRERRDLQCGKIEI